MNPDITAAQKVDPQDARRIELATAQCEELSILPSAAARFLAQLGRMELTPSSLAELVESDPALTILVLRLCQKKGVTINRWQSGFQQALEALSLREIRDAVLSAKIYGGLSDEPRTEFRREITRHSLAVACCAEQLSRLTTPPLESHIAYLAGLLHDIGKFLLDEVMPKSFDTLLEQARSAKTDFCRVERENLGTDHTISGKRYAQKLHLPSDIILGIWLHHSQSGTIAQAMPQARIAAIVELADGIVRRIGIGDSGSYDEIAQKDIITEALGLTAGQTGQVEQRLPELVSRRGEIAGLNLLRPGWAYSDALRIMTGQLATESSKLFEEAGRLQDGAGRYEFVSELLSKINSAKTAIELAGDFAVLWQKFYRTGPVCVYLAGPSGSKAVEAAIVDNQAQLKTVVLNVPQDVAIIPQAPGDGASGFAVLDAADYVNWLLEQVEVDFDLTRTKLAGLWAGDRTAGAIVFELRHPVKGDIAQRFAPAARFGGVILDMLESSGRQQWYAERFAQLLTAPIVKPQQLEKPLKPELEVLAEMAAGAAHELNNPLSVIRGRAQLLAGSETDADKKRVLEQIQQNAGELSAIIEDLMSYASPEKPRPTETTPGQIINDAVDLTSQKKGVSRLDIKIDVPPDIPNVFVDSAQIAIAVSNIICNALESYDSGAGPVTINVVAGRTQGDVTIQVIDSGRGMDEQTLAKATQPFFSARPAGRRRGMGLAHAQQLIQINKGILEIASQPARGTTVTVVLPCQN